MKISWISRIRKRWIFNLYQIRLFLMPKHKKRLFIDCGSNLGQGFSFFRKYFPCEYYNYVLVEPNPNCASALREKYQNIDNLEIIEAAVWIDDGHMNLFGLVEDGRGTQSDGASIIENHNNAFYNSDTSKATKVQTIDFARLLKEKANFDQIIVKMDIESSEYNVLEKLIDEELLDKIDFMFIEFHSQYMTKDTKHSIEEREQKIKKHLNDKHKLYIWH
ncbi:FkbM family methyltransferase [Kiloniella sp.]|uniref:FkbM family methyltransferase n=1 Tax=Kiloniella sp. TaxID=1938587 RepID=UPI003A902ED4